MRARSLFVAVSFTVMAFAGCTSDPTTAPASPSATPSPSPSPIPSGPVRFVPGEYSVDISGVRADLSLDGGAGTLTVENGSTVDLGQASLGVINANDNGRADATLDGPDQVAIGEEATYEVQLPEGVTIDDIGLVHLSFDGVSLALLLPVIDEA